MEKLFAGKIGKVHLLYISSIFVVIIILLTSLLFSKSDYAGEILSFAATLSSILLAVVAIIITLIDVAGQRSNVLDVKTGVDDLKNLSKSLEEMIDLTLNTIQQSQEDFKIDLSEALSKLDGIESSQNKEVNDQIKEVKRSLTDLASQIERKDTIKHTNEFNRFLKQSVPSVVLEDRDEEYNKFIERGKLIMSRHIKDNK